MSPEEYLKDLNKEFDQTIEHLKSELAKLHTGRASASLVEDLKVNCYGGTTLLKSLALVNVPSAREFQIEVWDQNAIKPIVEALTKASLGAMPSVEGRIIRLTLPPLTGESRARVLKLMRNILEDAKISLRMKREKVWNEIQKQEKEGNIREDEKFRLKDKIQEKITEYSKTIDEIGKRKEKEIQACNT